MIKFKNQAKYIELRMHQIIKTQCPYKTKRCAVKIQFSGIKQKVNLYKNEELISGLSTLNQDKNECDILINIFINRD